MYLEKLELQGFKSFAQPTTLVFNKQLTAIVGPNGSGKSNVADAIRWVLGEQSLKLLRGKKSDDVIFAGSDLKGRLGFARVTLYLDNHNREAGIDYDQVVVDRTVDRSGESEYRINGSKVRLVDVQILLAKAHVGQKSYSVIGQGMIDSLLSISVQERKDLFDEATGVRHFQLKKGQSLHKLEQTDENLQQAELVLQEIEPRLRTLSRQVRRLEKKEELERQLKQQQNDYYSYRTGILTAELDGIQKKVTTEQEALDALTLKQHAIQTALDVQEHEEGRNEMYNMLQKKLYNVQQEYNVLTKKKIVLEGQHDLDLIKSGDSGSVLLKQRQEELIARKNTLETSLTELSNHVRTDGKAVSRLESMVSVSQIELKKIEHELSTEAKTADWKLLEKAAQVLTTEQSELIELLEELEHDQHRKTFKDKFKGFVEKIRSFINDVRDAGGTDRQVLWERFTKLRTEHERVVDDLHAEESALQVKQHELKLLTDQLHGLEREIASLTKELSSDGSMRHKTASEDLAHMTDDLAEKDKLMETLRHDIDNFNREQESKKTELVGLQKQFRTLQYDVTVQNNGLTTLKVELAKIETKKEDLDKEITQEAPSFTYHQIKTLREDEVRESIAAIKRQLNIIGGIDAETVKEYTEANDKYTFLKQQTTDLRSAQKSLIQLITELDEHITKQFEQSFKNINTLFMQYFKKLFNGGHAKLVLQMMRDQEPEEAAAEGETQGDTEKKAQPSLVQKIKAKHFDYTVEIQASPPGKKLANIAMLSGGEKALTSIALICAIIAQNPPPFVVLDEVDAALDEANSIRFAEIVAELVDKSQFITITHNRATMHQAQILYGVTMGDDGISRLLSVNFDQADQLSA